MKPHIANILTTRLRRTVLKKPLPPFLNARNNTILPASAFAKLISHPSNPGTAYCVRLKAYIKMNVIIRAEMLIITKLLMNFLKSPEFSICCILDFLFYLPE